MAKESSAERVGPITRANYTGNPNNAEPDGEYDPLAALASLVGNIDNDVAKSNEPVVEDAGVDLESELIKDFHDADVVDIVQQPNFSDIEKELTIALGAEETTDAGVGEIPDPAFENSPPQDIEQDQPEPVLQSFESLNDAFGVLPDVDEREPLAAEPVIDPADLAIEEQLLQELSNDPAPDYLQATPVAEIEAGFADTVQQPEDFVEDNVQMDLPSDQEFTAEFESAMADSAAELIGEPQAVDVIAAEIPFAQQVGDYVEEEKPFGKLASAVTMPPVGTPFDHQVDDALNDILIEESQPEGEFGWSGDLAGELEHIVSSTETIKSTDIATELRSSEDLNDIYVEGPTVSQSTEELGELQDDAIESAGEIAGIPDFEQEFSDQSNPDIHEDPFVAIPEFPEFLEENGHDRKGLKVTVAVLGIAAIVATGAFGWNYFSAEEAAGPDLVIMASTDPVKIKPKEPGGVKVPNQDQIVFEKVNGKSQDNTNQEKLASGAEAPIRVVTTSSVPPVVQPLPVGSSAAESAKSSARISPSDTILVRTEQAIISPRKVRTVVVRPDGTIVAVKKSVSPAKPAKSAEPVKVASVAKQTDIIQPAALIPAGSTDKKLSPVGAALPINNAPKISVAPIEKAVPKPVAIVPAKKVKVQPVKKVAVPKKVIPVSRPVKLATASTGGYVMQISSQRSAEAAQTSYNRLSKRFAGILGGKGVDIRRIRLKDKGIYYRVRIPTESKKSAINLCTRYKSAGGSCFVTR